MGYGGRRLRRRRGFAGGEGWPRQAAAARLKRGRALLEQERLEAAAPEIHAALAFFDQYDLPDLLGEAKLLAARLRLGRGELSTGSGPVDCSVVRKLFQIRSGGGH